MADPQKLVLMVQTIKLQGLIWQAVLKSQRIGVIWESPEANLVENLDQLKAAGLTLPELLLVDMQVPNFNPYAFCRWCKEQYPGLKVVLTNASQSDISLSERQWAVNQGASDLLPGFEYKTLVTGVVAAVKRILEILDDHPLNNGALISVLLSMKRELESRAKVTPSVSTNGNGKSRSLLVYSNGTSAPMQPTLQANGVLEQPLYVTNGTNGKTVTQTRDTKPLLNLEQFSTDWPAREVTQHSSSIQPPVTDQPPTNDQKANVTPPMPPTRKLYYRGVSHS